jgi:hypothetical protein
MSTGSAKLSEKGKNKLAKFKEKRDAEKAREASRSAEP